MFTDYSLEEAEFLYEQWDFEYNPIRFLNLMMLYYKYITSQYEHHVLEPMYQYWYEVVRELPVDDLYESIHFVELHRILDEELEAQSDDDDTDLIVEYVKSLPLADKQSSVNEFFA